MRPDRVTDDNAQEVWRRLHGNLWVKRERPVRFKFKVGDWVRITKKENICKGLSIQLDGKDFPRGGAGGAATFRVPVVRIRRHPP